MPGQLLLLASIICTMLNISATLNVFRLLLNPSLCKPHLVVPTFNQIQIPIRDGIKAVVLDKDNCISYPDSQEVWPEYDARWKALKEYYPGKALLIVSNSAGSGDDPGGREAENLEKATGVTVLKHSTKKPGCWKEILDYFYRNKVISHPSEVAVVGDRLFTDMLMAGMMNSYGVWLTDGVRPSKNLICRFEKLLSKRMGFENHS